MDGPDREVIVVDNTKGDPQTERVTARAGAHYVVENRVGLSHARNAGVDAATGELIAFIDDDAIADTAWLSHHAEVLADDSLTASTGRILPLATGASEGGERETPRPLDLGTRAFVVDRSYPLWFERANLGGLASGSNMVLKREVFDTGVRFKETLGLGATLGGFEDFYFFYKMIERGGRVAYVPRAVIKHGPDLSAHKPRLARRLSAAYLTMLLVEEPGSRPRAVRYIARLLRRQPLPWRRGTPPSRLEVVADGYRGALVYLRSRLARR
jgi:GT2 family glycosyltransferase